MLRITLVFSELANFFYSWTSSVAQCTTHENGESGLQLSLNFIKIKWGKL